MAAASIAAAEIERAADEATKIVASLLTLGPDAIEQLQAVSTSDHDGARAWHRSNLSLAEAYALLWQQDDKGGTVKRSDDSNARLFAAHMIDLILAGRIQLFWSTKTRFLQVGAYKKLRIMVASTESVSVSATSTLLQHLKVLQENRRKKGKNPISLQNFIRDHIGDSEFHRGIGYELEQQTFANLVERGILDKEKRKNFLFLERTIYPTSDPTPEAMLIQDLRAVMKREGPSTAHMELLLKLIARTTKLFSAKEEAADNNKLLKLRKLFKHDEFYSLLNDSVGGGSGTPQVSPFAAGQELSVRLLVDQAAYS